MHDMDETSKEAPQNLVKIRQVWQKKPERPVTSKVGIGFSPLKLKIRKEASRHISVEEVHEEQMDSPKPRRNSVFKRLGASGTRRSVFERLSVRRPRRLVFERIGEKSVETSSGKPNSIHSRLGSSISKKIGDGQK